MPTDPIVYHAHDLPRKRPVYRLTFRFSAGTIGVSKGLLQRLELGPSRRIDFVRIDEAWYIMGVEEGGVRCSVTTGAKRGQAGAIIYRRSLTDLVRQKLNVGPDEVLRVEVDPAPLEAIRGINSGAYPVFRLPIESACSDLPKPGAL